MGQAVSTSVKTTEASLMEQSVSKCPSIAVSGKIDLSNITHEAPTTCKTSSFNVDQNVAVDHACLLSTMQSGLADKLIQGGANAQTGIGLSVSTDVNTIKNNIQAKIAQDCGNVKVDAIGEISNLKMKVCDFKYVQNTDAKSRCEINTVQNLSDKLVVDTGASAQGLTLGGWFGNGPIIIAGVVVGGIVLAFVAFVIYKLVSSFSPANTEYTYQQGGALKDILNFKQCHYEMLIILLLLAVIYMDK